MWETTDHRPLDGFVYADHAVQFHRHCRQSADRPALMGNTVIWKPSPTQTFAAYLIMELLEAAGLPPGESTMLTGDGIAVSEVALADPRLAGIHFTGSTHVPASGAKWAPSIERYGAAAGWKTGGKDFVVAHTSRSQMCCARRFAARSTSKARSVRRPRARSSRRSAADGRLPGRHRGPDLRRRHRSVQIILAR